MPSCRIRENPKTFRVCPALVIGNAPSWNSLAISRLGNYRNKYFANLQGTNCHGLTDGHWLGYYQGWAFVLFIFRSWLFRSQRSKKTVNVRESILSLFKKEPLWANHSLHSLQNSDCERIPSVALYKRATVSESIMSIFTKERQWANRSCRSFKKSDKSNSLFFMSESLIRSFVHKKRAIRS